MAASPCNEADTYAEKPLHSGSQQLCCSEAKDSTWQSDALLMVENTYFWRHALLCASQKGHRGNWEIDRDMYQLLISPAFVYGSVFTNSSISWNMQPLRYHDSYQHTQETAFYQACGNDFSCKHTNMCEYNSEVESADIRVCNGHLFACILENKQAPIHWVPTCSGN